MRSAWILGVLLFGLGCTTVPVGAVPDPLPEALAWELPGGDTTPFLGLQVEENDSGSLDGLFFAPGVRVVEVVQNSPAARAGFAPRDVVLRVGDADVNDPEALDALVARHDPGARLRLAVQRDDTVFDVELELAVREASGSRAVVEQAYHVDRTRTLGGWATAPGGVRLVSRAEHGPLHRAGVEVGELVTTLDGERVHSARDLLRRLDTREPGDDVRLGVGAPGGDVRREVEVELADVDTVVTGFGVPFLLEYDARADGSYASWSLLDLWFFELFQWTRDGPERRWVLFELFGFDLIHHASDVGVIGT